MKTRALLAIALAVSWATASARDYMGMEPVIVNGDDNVRHTVTEDTMVFTPRGVPGIRVFGIEGRIDGIHIAREELHAHRG